MRNEGLIVDLGDRVKLKELSWHEACKEYNECTNSHMTDEGFRTAYRRLSNDDTPVLREYKTFNADGSITAQQVVEFTQEIFGDKDKLLAFLGYDPTQWKFASLSTSLYEQHTKEQTTKNLHAVKYKVVPTNEAPANPELVIEDIQECFSKITPYEPKPIETEGDGQRLMELPGMELHLGKVSWESETGRPFNTIIAVDRFHYIMDNIHQFQAFEKCANCVLYIGNDFFNSDTFNATTTKGTPQDNDIHWKEMFITAVRLYAELIEMLLADFIHIDVKLCVGNHDRMSSFYLYYALMQRYRNEKRIKFCEDYKECQVYVWGNSAIFTHHGDVKQLERLIRSIPAEFSNIWGTVKYRELHLGHLHKEMATEDEYGMTTRRVGSPTGIDYYHYSERFIGATQKYQVFIWDKQTGLEAIKYINF